MTTQTYPYCGYCDSPNVTADAAVVWDMEAQCWISEDGSCYDMSSYCHDCNEEFRYFEHDCWEEVSSIQFAEVPHA